MTATIRRLQAVHWPEAAPIFAAGLATGNATFETEVPSWDEWDASHLADHRFVATLDDAVVGWTAVSAVSDRCVYAGVVEHSVYVGPGHQGQGIGTALLGALIVSTERAGVWTIQSGVFPENRPSLALHRHCGFRTVGTRSRLGQVNGVWRDVVMIERRSTVI